MIFERVSYRECDVLLIEAFIGDDEIRKSKRKRTNGNVLAKCKKNELLFNRMNVLFELVDVWRAVTQNANSARRH
jgi:hypothetical protein